MNRKVLAGGMAGLLFLLAVVLGQAGRAAAYENDIRDEIRVGLKSFYTEQREITIYGDFLQMGFCDGQSFVTAVTIKDCGQAVVQPEKRKYYGTTDVLTAEEAGEKQQELAHAGFPAKLVLYAPDEAGILFFTEQVSDAGGLCRAAEELGVQLSGEPKDSHLLLGITYGTKEVYADGSRGFFPQFAAGAGQVTVNLGKRCYRGRIEIGRYGGSSLVSAVNVVPIEEYLYGVVPCEMPASWSMEALKAQAVCARSFAMVKAGFHSMTDTGRGYQLVDTEQSQVYGGAGYEKDASTRAVNATRGETLCYGNRTVCSYYFSASGGYTEDSGDVWNFTLPYLRAVPDVYETNSGGKLWSVSLKKEELEALLERNGKSVGSIYRITPAVTTQSGRVMVLKITGTKGSVELSTSFIRNSLNFSSTKFKVVLPGDTPDTVTVLGAQGKETTRLRDCTVLSADKSVRAGEGASQLVVLSADNLTNFPIEAPKENAFLFAGLGYGHGVGMSQAGARGMAEKGFTYKQILEHYFTGISVR